MSIFAVASVKLRLLQTALALSTATVCPAPIITLFADVGTTAPTQVAGLLQFPLLAEVIWAVPLS